MKAKLQSHPMPSAVKITDSPLSEEILECEFPNKFLAPTFDCYSGVNDPVQHTRYFRDKMVVYFHNDSLMCLTFPSNVKGVASNWFFFLTLQSLHNFEEVTQAFLTQYASHWEAKRNNHHLLSIKMRQSDNLKCYISYFQGQLAKASTAMRTSLHSRSSAGCKSLTPYTKHLLKRNVTRMSEVLSQAQPYISWRRQ